MAKQVKGQKDLIDVLPEEAKPIIGLAKKYKKVQAVRLKMLAEETALKEEVISLVEAAELQPLKGGIVSFECEGMQITVTPTKKSLTVTDRATETDQK